MEIQLAYGGSVLKVALPENVTVDQFAPQSVGSPVEPQEHAGILSSSQFDHFFQSDSVLFVVNDGYRHTPTAQLLAMVESRYKGILDHAHFLIATGTHKAPTEEHLTNIFGHLLERVRPRIHVHVATDSASMEQVGIDSFREPVFLNKLLKQFETVIVIGSVEPHYFAGYTGGRKGIFPGLCDLATTTRNHNMANSLDAAPLRLKGNPVAEHLQSLLTFVADLKILSIQVVADASHRIAAIFIGDFEKSFTSAVEKAFEMYAHTVAERYDIILCEVMSPLDKNLYQVQKAVENSQAAVKDSGALIVIAACREGIGSDYFFDEASRWDKTHNRPGDGVYRFGSHKLTRMVQHQRRINVCLKSELPEKTVSTVFYHPIGDLLEYLHAQLRPNARVAVVRDAAHTVLQFDQSLHTTVSTHERVL